MYIYFDRAKKIWRTLQRMWPEVRQTQVLYPSGGTPFSRCFIFPLCSMIFPATNLQLAILLPQSVSKDPDIMLISGWCQQLSLISWAVPNTNLRPHLDPFTILPLALGLNAVGVHLKTSDLAERNLTSDSETRGWLLESGVSWRISEF